MGATKYPNLQLLFDAYLNQDYDLHGETITEVIRVYRADLDEAMRQGAIAEIERWMREHRQDLASAFEACFEREISITSHGYTAPSFFEELERVLSE
jgi:hypothetical protein